MQLVNGLPRVFTVVENEAIARLRDAQAARDFSGGEQHPPEELSMLGPGAWGATSGKGTQWSSSYTMSAGISRRMILSKIVMGASRSRGPPH